MSNALKIAAARFDAPRTLYQIISDAGLTSGLKLCLDAGDSASYNPSVQTDKWLDTSGGGYDFYRGYQTGSDVGDPTFNGSAGGLSSSEYWSSDGGDYFSYDTTNETWMNNMHKSGAIWTVFYAFMQPVTGTSQTSLLFSTARNAASGIGAQLTQGSSNTNGGATGQILFNVRNGTTLAVNGMGSLGAGTQGQWQVGGVSWDEALTTDRLISVLNGSIVKSSVANAAALSSSNADGFRTMSYVTTPPTAPSANGNGFRLACLAVWEGTKLSEGQLVNLYSSLKGRFGL